MAASTHIPNSTVADCRMHVPRRRNTSTAQSWRFVPDAILPGHRRAHWWVPAWTPTVHQCPHSGKAVGGSTAHTSTWHRGTQQTRKTPKKIHEVTNMDSMIRAHGSGACCGHTGEQFCQRLPGTDTANEELSTVTEYLTKSNDMCAVVTELDDTRHPEHCAQPWTREGWMECRLS